MTEPKPLGQIAYEAYGQVTEFKNFRGDPMPEWPDLPDKIREAWEAAAEAIWSEAT